MALILKIFRNQNGNRYGILLGNYLTCTVLAGIMMPKGEAGFPVGGLTVGSLTAGSLTAGGITWLCGICAPLHPSALQRVLRQELPAGVCAFTAALPGGAPMSSKPHSVTGMVRLELCLDFCLYDVIGTSLWWV